MAIPIPSLSFADSGPVTSGAPISQVFGGVGGSPFRATIDTQAALIIAAAIVVAAVLFLKR